MSDPLVFPVAIEAPAEVHVAGRRWFRRPELHVTTFSPEGLASATGLDVDMLTLIGERLCDELTAVRPIRLDGRVSVVSDIDGRRTLVAFCDVEGLEQVYERLSAIAGRELPRPPTHVTLYTAQPGMGGIGLSTAADVAAKAVALQRTAAAKVLADLK